ncbi:hypothetical protein JCM10212_004044 [Sporobolomyces blumeae]
MLGLLLLGLAAVLASRLVSTRQDPSSAPPTFRYFHPLVPTFLSGLVAVVKLGKDEDEFLRELYDEYGGVVYLPWPMQRYFVLETQAIEQVYRAPSKTLSFMPIRRELQGSVFEAPYWRDRDLMEGQFYSVHGRGFRTPRLEGPVDRFVSVVRSRVEHLATRLDGLTPRDAGDELVVSLDELVTDLFYDASFVALFGAHVRDASGISAVDLREAFDKFDHAFPLLASGLLPAFLLDRIPDVKVGRQGFDVLAKTLQAWIEGGFEGLDEGVVKDMAQVALDNWLGSKEAGKMLVADLWALQANAPFIASQLLVHLLQAPGSLLDEVTSESRAASEELGDLQPSLAFLNQGFPLLQSCITETIRLGTASFSIRDVEQPFVVTARMPSTTARTPPGFDTRDAKTRTRRDVVVPARSKLICATRNAHLDDAVWDGNAAEWDGKRFLDAKGDTLNSGKARKVWGFGGGISRCEGSQFATLELKALFSTLFSTFDMSLAGPDAREVSRLDVIEFAGGETGYKPKRRPGRVGMGAFQFVPGHGLKVRLRRRSGQ